SAVGDDLAVGRDALAAVDLLQLFSALEGAVLGVDGRAPRNADRGRDMATALRAFLRQVLRRQQLARELLRRADVDQPGLAELRLHVVLVCANVLVCRAMEVVRRGGIAGDVGGVRATFLLPLHAPAVDQLDLVV